MKTITPEIKACIAALYYGQKIMQTTIKHDPNNLSGLMWVEPIAFKEEGSQYFLNVTPLQNITDEDAIEVAKIWGDDGQSKIANKVIASRILDENYKAYFPFSTCFKIADYLRSRGYALPYMNYSVSDLVELGVFKLKNHE